MSSERLESKIQSLLSLHRRDAVLLYRLYPPHEGPRGNSKFGGLPRLPDHYEWPRASHSVPFHFFAQIDCSEIPFPTPLPDRGVLFFFGRDDDHMWGFEGPANDDCRVIHALDASAATPQREAPPDLPPIGGSWGHPTWRYFQPVGETGPALHVEWPVRPLRIDSWSDSSAVPFDPELGQRSWNPVGGHWQMVGEGDSHEDFYDRYAEVLAERSNTAFFAATGEEPSFRVGGCEETMRIAASLLFDAGGGFGAWPDRWIHVHYFARAVLHRPDQILYAENAGEMRAAGEVWLERSLAQPPVDEIPEEDRRAFQQWVVSIRGTQDTRPISSSAAAVVLRAAAAAIRAWAGDPALAALIPLNVYAAMAGSFGGADVWGADYSQMLGHAPSAQEARFPDDPTLCLLNLSSQDGTGWMFGDVGNLTFWITPEDLSRLDFDKVWGAIEGH